MLQKLFISHPPIENPFEYHPNALNIFVGPNNSGKSLLLREIYQSLTGSSPSSSENLLIDGIVTTNPPESDVELLLKKNNEKQLSSYENFLYFFQEDDSNIGNMSMQTFHNFSKGVVDDYKSDEYRIYKHRLFSKKVLLLNGATRLESMTPKEFSTISNTYISNPVNSLLNNDDLFEKMREYIFDAFSLYLEIFINGGLGNFVLSKDSLPEELRLSVKPEATKFLLDNSSSDIDSSDGRKAYLGILSEIVAGNPSLLLLDEPEAFLHPPLARKLGTVVSKLIDDNQNKQVFIATHSADFIMGCIEARVPMNIVRLTYENEQSTFKPINQEILEKILNNPLLKSTNILKAIFYQKVIVTESDSDRAFYEEINSRLLEYKPEWGIKDCLFINAQNKQTTGIIVKTLRDIGVSAVSIVDLDFIKDGKGEFSDKYLTPVNIDKASHSGLQSHRTVLKETFDKMQSATGQKNPELMKLTGLQTFKDSNAGAYTMGYEFLQTLNSYGLFPVHCGELESWLKYLNVPGHGSNWLTGIFEKMGDSPTSDNFVKPSDNDVWEFIYSIKQWFDNPNKKGMVN